MEINITFEGGMKVFARTDEYTIASDQPLKNGGEGSAPDPFTYFISSFGTCAGYYVLRFCQSRNIPTDGIHINVSNDFDAKRHLAENIKITVELPDVFPDKYESALRRAIDQCTVKKTVQNQPNIEVESYFKNRRE